ncbi:MAG: hypothetical protein SF182_11750 [Deltaproteobacteria bacterium]|nr:hypothetical protein [Deltaproteobacteria bacterium]
MQIWSTEPGGGALTIQWHFDDPKLHMGVFCAGGQCLYSTVDPGFITSADPPPEGSYALADGTAVRAEIVALDAGTTLKINGVALDAPGESTQLEGIAPALHSHPSWQLKLAQGVQGSFSLSFRLVTDAPQYAASAVYTVVLTTEPGPTMTPTASPTPTATPPASRPCAGDCNENGAVSIDELIAAVNIALDPSNDPTICRNFDPNQDGQITINELVQFVSAALGGCDSGPTPTATRRPATFAEIQQAILQPRCAIATCHDDEFESGDLNLTADAAYDELFNVPPDIESAAAAGLLRVDDFDPDNSFLLIKLTGPPLGQGSRMPLVGDPLSAEEIQLIRDWIAAGAPNS